MVNQRSSRTRQKRRWAMRAAAFAVPFVFLAILEIVFRIAGAYEDATTQLDLAGDIQIKEFPEGTYFFAEWNALLEMPKPKTTRRIFVLGGSTSQGFGVAKPFSQLIEEALTEESPEFRWEVVNGGKRAFGSHRVLEVLKRACEFDPDLIVVYLGHNEFIEDVFFHPDGLVSQLHRFQCRVRQLRVVNFFRRITSVHQLVPAPKLRRHNIDNTNFPLIHSAEMKRLRIQFLKANIRKMIDYCDERETSILLMPAVENLLFPPGDPLHGNGVEVDENAWTDTIEKCRNAAQKESWAEVAQYAMKLQDMDAEYADGHFYLGLARIAAGEHKLATEALIQASELDWRGNRASPKIQEAILAVANEEGIASIDVRHEFSEHIPRDFQLYLESSQQVYFFDHCHPSQKGHEIIADACIPVIRQIIQSSP